MSRRVRFCSLLVVGLLVTACDSRATGIPEDTGADGASSDDGAVLCGNGIREGDEECDRQDFGATTCVELGYGSGTLTCNYRCLFDPIGCSESMSCGDEVVDVAEECDDGNDVGWDGCTGCRITEFRINLDDYFFCEASSVAVDFQGGIFVAWEGCYCGEDGCWCYLFGRLLDAQTTLLGADFEISPANSFDLKAPSAIALAGGGFVATWLGDPNETISRALGQRYDGSGVALGDPFPLDTQVDGPSGTADVAADLDGTFVAVWSRSESDGGSRLMGQRFWGDATGDGTSFPLNDDPPGGGGYPSVGIAGDSTIVAVWTQCQDLDGDGCGIFGRRFFADGVPAGPRFQVNTLTSGSQRWADLAVAPDGHFVVVWQSEGVGGDYDGIYAQFFGADATPTGPELLVSELTIEAQCNAAVAWTADGAFTVVWEDQSDHYGQGYTVVGRRYFANGSSSSAPFPVNRNTLGYHGNSSIAAADDGGFLVIWHGPDMPNFWDGNLYGQRFDAAGNALGGEL